MAVQLVHQYLGGAHGGVRDDRRAPARRPGPRAPSATRSSRGSPRRGRERRLAPGDVPLPPGRARDRLPHRARGAAGDHAGGGRRAGPDAEPRPGRLPGRDGAAHRHPLPRDAPPRWPRRVVFELDGDELRRLAFTHPAAAARVPPGDRVGERRGQGARARPREAARGGQARRGAGARAQQPRRRRRARRRDAARVRAPRQEAFAEIAGSRRAGGAARPRSPRSAPAATERTVAGRAARPPRARATASRSSSGRSSSAALTDAYADRVHADRGAARTTAWVDRVAAGVGEEAWPPACASWRRAPARASARRAGGGDHAHRRPRRRRQELLVPRPGAAPDASTSTRGSRARSRCWATSCARSGSTIVRDFDPELPGVEASGSELNQVWTNLIDNAVDALGAGGRLTLRTRTPGRARLRRDRRRRAGDPRGPAGPHLRRLLHHQAGRPGHRPRARHRPAHRGPPPRRAAPRVAARRHPLPGAAAPPLTRVAELSLRPARRRRPSRRREAFRGSPRRRRRRRGRPPSGRRGRATDRSSRRRPRPEPMTVRGSSRRP